MRSFEHIEIDEIFHQHALTTDSSLVSSLQCERAFQRIGETLFGKVDISATSWLTRVSKLLILDECPDAHCSESRRPRSRVVTSSNDRRRSRLLRTSGFRGSKWRD